jgi:hypothetical protein
MPSRADGCSVRAPGDTLTSGLKRWVGRVTYFVLIQPSRDGGSGRTRTQFPRCSRTKTFAPALSLPNGADRFRGLALRKTAFPITEAWLASSFAGGEAKLPTRG